MMPATPAVPPYVIRRGTLADVPAVVDLAARMVVHSISPYRKVGAEAVMEFRRKDLATLESIVSLPHIGLFVAVDEQQRLLGHVVVVCNNMESSTGELQGWVFDLAVVPECWHAGLGHALMLEAERFTAAFGHDYLGLGVTTANERAVGFYERLGYAEERKRLIKRLDRSNQDAGASEQGLGQPEEALP
jgi:ribosomal protein S18 acetylase RimI-like enzyme